MKSHAVRGIGILVASFLALILLPLIVRGYYLTVLILIFYYAYVGQAWNIMTGFSGQLSLGHALFIGLGGYTSAALIVYYGIAAWISVVAAGVVGAIAALLLAYLAFRFAVRGVYFALLTLAVSEFALVLFSNWDFVNGSGGLFFPAIGPNNDPLRSLRGGSFFYYYLFFCLAVAALALSWWLSQSRIGYFWRAIAADEDAARAIGVHSFSLKILAVVISGLLTAIGGAFYALFAGSLFPETVFPMSLSIAILLGPVVGGMGTLIGPILGAVFIVPLSEGASALAEQLSLTGLNLVVQGAVISLIILFLPQGIWPPLRQRLRIGGRET